MAILDRWALAVTTFTQQASSEEALQKSARTT